MQKILSKIVTILLTGMLLLLTGCSMNENEQNALRDFEKAALAYYENKYDTDVSLLLCICHQH